MRYKTSSEELLNLITIESWPEDLWSAAIKALPSSSLINIHSDLDTLLIRHRKNQHSAALARSAPTDLPFWTQTVQCFALAVCVVQTLKLTVRWISYHIGIYFTPGIRSQFYICLLNGYNKFTHFTSKFPIPALPNKPMHNSCIQPPNLTAIQGAESQKAQKLSVLGSTCPVYVLGSSSCTMRHNTWLRWCYCITRSHCWLDEALEHLILLRAKNIPLICSGKLANGKPLYTEWSHSKFSSERMRNIWYPCT